MPKPGALQSQQVTASVLPRQHENRGRLLGNPALQASTTSPHRPQAAAFEAFLL